MRTKNYSQSGCVLTASWGGVISGLFAY